MTRRLIQKKQKFLIAALISFSIYWNILKEKIKPFLNWKFVVSFFFAWMITNGWSYIALGIGVVFEVSWLITVAGGYQTFLWLPCTPEKIVTIPLAICIHRLLFPRDFKNIEKLNRIFEKEKRKLKRK